MNRFPDGDEPPFRVVIQARMSSERFPGKCLAPLGGRPLIGRVVDRVAGAVGKDTLLLATSTAPSDDPLAGYVTSLGIPVVRGPLDDVAARFRAAVREHPCRWCFRVSGDSPFFDGALFGRFLEHVDRTGVDLVTNVFPRTFPRGHSLEMIRSRTLLDLDDEALTSDQREHVTRFFYDHADRYSIVSVTSDDPERAQRSYTVDTMEDLRRLERMAERGDEPAPAGSGHDGP